MPMIKCKIIHNALQAAYLRQVEQRRDNNADRYNRQTEKSVLFQYNPEKRRDNRNYEQSVKEPIAASRSSLQEELKNCRLDIHAPVDKASADNSEKQRGGIENNIRHEYSLHAGKKISAVITLI